MGQGFSLTTLSAGSAGIDVPELADLVYEKSMGTARFMKSIRARQENGVVLVKVVVKPGTMRLDKYSALIKKERKALADVPNALPYQRIVETETSGFLVRQYLYSSLYDRMSTRPFLDDIEKKWLAFQLLCAVRDCHAREVFHGDIKTENVLVTSWNWLYLTDFSSSFKPTKLPEDNPADFSYFFDTAGRRTCYLAPERFIGAKDQSSSEDRLTWAMDIFSVGCVIAELFLEAPIFTLSQLFQYRKGDFDPITTHLNRIGDKDVREMISNMINPVPESRYSADEYLNFWRNKVFPEYFYSFLHQYMGLITDPSSGRSPISGSTANLGEPDDRIDRIYHDFDKISYFLGYDEEKQAPPKPISAGLGLEVLPVHLNIPNNERQAMNLSRKSSDDGSLLFLAVVVSSMRNTARATARLRACDLLLAFSERLTDEAKLDRILPYAVSLLYDKADAVKVAAIRTITQLMALVNVVSPVNAHIFPEYLLPRMASFLPGDKSKPSVQVRATYAACLGSLATSASRILDVVATLRADGTLPTADLETEDGADMDAALQGVFDNARVELIEFFESHTKALVTDNDSAVKRAFLGSVPDLCMFFGTAASNDIILSHLNTYLNDRDWMLKCAFFETVVGVATFLGGTSLEEFILPLMVQALTDPEEFVIRSVLHSFADMAALGLFQRSKIWELVDIVGRFTMHPDIWIREAAVNFIASSTVYLSEADNQCIILPMIKPYLKTSVTDFSELTLLDALKKPLSRAVLDITLNWARTLQHGIFWKSAQQLRTFSLDSDKSIPTQFTKDSSMNAMHKIPKNQEDEQWLTKLRNVGLGPDDDFKLLALREYIWRLARSTSGSSDSLSHYSEILKLRSHGITPQTVMFDDEPVLNDTPKEASDIDAAEKGSHTIADALLDASMSIEDTVSKRKRSAVNGHKARLSRQASPLSSSPNGLGTPSALSTSPIMSSSPRDTDTEVESRRSSLAIPRSTHDRKIDAAVGSRNSSTSTREINHGIRHQGSAINLMNRQDRTKSIPETSTTRTSAFGKVEGPFSHSAEPAAIGRVKAAENVATGNRFKAPHTYSGNDPSIINMLNSMYLNNYPNDIAEFGPLISVGRHKSITRSNTQAGDVPWKPEGVLVATFAEHVGAVRHIAVAPDHMFFLTGGDDGAVKVWDSGRLERNVTHRSRQTHRNSTDSKISALCFVEYTHTFVSCADDGTVNVVRIECVPSSGAARYGKLRLLREYQLPDNEYAVCANHFKAESNSVLLLATNRSRLLAIDLRNMNILYTLENPVHHGTPTCICVDKRRNWLLVGTSHGVLDLWDIRFKSRLQAWGVPGAASIYSMSIHPTKGRGKWVCVAGGNGHGEVTVWDIEKMQCREVYRAGAGRDGNKGYDAWAVDEDRPEGMLGRFATALEPNESSNSDRGVRAMVTGTDSHDEDSKHGFIIAAGSDKKVRFWDLARVENSMVVNGLEAEEPKPTFTQAHPSASLTLNSERIPRPGPTAPNAAAGSRSSSTYKTANGRPARSTVISLQQQQLLKSHLDSIMAIAFLESPYGMVISADRSGVIFVFQ